jgi:ABC-type nickel/cobalt efflux system permease component RcnA
MVDAGSIAILATGFALGLVHSLDPDHIVAVSTVICKTPNLRKCISSAAIWGIGHSAMLFIVGLLVLGLRVAIPESVFNFFELGAAIMLIFLGFLVIKPAITHKLQPHDHPCKEDTKIVVENKEEQHHQDHDHNHAHIHGLALTGIFQGLAGSSSIMLVTLTTVSSFEIGLTFLALFGVGVILSMAGIACLIGTILDHTTSKLESVHEKISLATGAFSISFGTYLIIQLIFQLVI